MAEQATMWNPTFSRINKLYGDNCVLHVGAVSGAGSAKDARVLLDIQPCCDCGNYAIYVAHNTCIFFPLPSHFPIP